MPKATVILHILLESVKYNDGDAVVSPSSFYNVEIYVFNVVIVLLFQSKVRQIMSLSQTLAMKIVEELSTILSQHINFIDKNGWIIASSDHSRIATLHMGAKKLIDEQLPYLIIHSDEEFPGAKKGVNLPIVVDNEIVGVIGITGEKERVEKYGEIIRKLTQMYIRDENQRVTRSQEEKMVARFLENWLMHAHTSHESNFVDVAASMGISLSTPRRIVMASFVDDDNVNLKDKQAKLSSATHYMRRMLSGQPDTYALRIGTRHVFLIHNTTDDNIYAQCKQIQHTVKQQYDWDVRFGYDAETFDPLHAHANYIQAKKALNAAIVVSTNPIRGYQDLYLELLLSEISTPLRHEFIDKLFKSMDLKHVHEAMQYVDVLYACEGSLSQAAATLFIHKNTLQYKLNKLTEHTGYDPRHMSSIPLYALASIFMKSLQFVKMSDDVK